MRLERTFATEHGPTFQVTFADLDDQLRFLRRLISGPKLTINGVTIGEYRADPVIRDLAVSILRNSGAEARDKKSQALAIGQWVQDNIYYVHEMPERFATPPEVLRAKAGDCDDGVTLIGSMLESVGIPAGMICMRVNGAWSHIFPTAIMQATGRQLPLDWTMKSFSVLEVKNPIVWAFERGKTVKIKVA
jgi:transglutaminase-like putative cysteine protease